MMRIEKISCIMFILGVVCVASLCAENKETVQKGTPKKYTSFRKAGRGMINACFGWMEIPVQMIKLTEEEGNIKGISWGLMKGFGCALGRTMIGVYELATAPLPPFEPRVEPEFIATGRDDLGWEQEE